MKYSGGKMNLFFESMQKRFTDVVEKYPTLIVLALTIVSAAMHCFIFTDCPVVEGDEAICLEMGRIGCIGNADNGCFHFFSDGSIPVILFQSGSRLLWLMFSVWEHLPRLFSFVLLEISAWFLYYFCRREFASSKVALLAVACFIFDPYLETSVQIARCDIMAIFVFLCIMLLLQSIGAHRFSMLKNFMMLSLAVVLSWIMLLIWITSAFYALVFVPYGLEKCRTYFKEFWKHKFPVGYMFLHIAGLCFVVLIVILLLVHALFPRSSMASLWCATRNFVSNEKYVNSCGNSYVQFVKLGLLNFPIYIVPFGICFLKKARCVFKKMLFWVILYGSIVFFTAALTSVYYGRLAYICPLGAITLAACVHGIAVKSFGKKIVIGMIGIGLLISFRYSLAGKIAKKVKYRSCYSTEYLHRGFSDIPIDKVIIRSRAGILYPIGIRFNWHCYHKVFDLDNQYYLDRENIAWAVIPAKDRNDSFLKKNSFKIYRVIDAPVVNGVENFNGSWEVWHRSDAEKTSKPPQEFIPHGKK